MLASAGSSVFASLREREEGFIHRSRGPPPPSTSSPGPPPPPLPPRAPSILSRAFRGLGWVMAGTVGTVCVGLLVSTDARERLVRNTRTVMAGAIITADYKYSLRGLDKGTEDYRLVQSSIHLRSAKRLLKLCKDNRGMYIKFGQTVASLPIQKEFTTTLSVLQDSAPTTNFDTVVRVFRHDFGRHPMEIFSEFDEKALAAASLAQVHHAVTRDGREVAVKIQYPHLEREFANDLYVWHAMSKAVTWLFPDVDLDWIVKEVEENIVQELDFENEGRNSDRVARCLSDMPNVRVPTVYWDLTSRHVLTMEFIHGVKVNDAKRLEAANVNIRTVASIVSQAFAKMIFCHGFVHCDPHPGNLLVEIDSVGTPTVVILDHGLYRSLGEEFRVNYARLWEGLVRLDAQVVKESCTALGFGQFAKIIPWMLTYRPLGAKQVTSTEEDRKKFIDEMKGITFGDTVDFLEALPRDLLFCLKTQNLVRSINLDLRGTSVDRFNTWATKAVLGYHLYKNGQKDYTWWEWVNYQVAAWRLAAVIWVAGHVSEPNNDRPFESDEDFKKRTRNMG